MMLTEFSKTYKPFLYPFAVDICKQHHEIHWVEDEADLSEDVSDWNLKLSKEERDFVTSILRLFTQSDVQVGQNYHDFLIPTFKNNEVRCMLASFADRETIHQRAYALLNDTLGLPDEEYRLFLDFKEMSDKIEFMSSGSLNSKSNRALNLSQSVFNEGMSLFSSFAMLLNFQRFGKMKGMCTIVEWSIRDETLHVEGNSKLFLAYIQENRSIWNDELKAKIYSMAAKGVELEDAFIDLAFANFTIQGITKEDMKGFIRYLADRRLLQLGLKPIFRTKENPLKWLDWILNGTSHDNFFEKRVTEYSLNSMSGEWDWPAVVKSLS